MIKNITLKKSNSHFWSSSDRKSRKHYLLCTIPWAFGWTHGILAVFLWSLHLCKYLMLPVSCNVNALLEQYGSSVYKKFVRPCRWEQNSLTKRDEFPNRVLMIIEADGVSTSISTNDIFPSRLAMKQSWVLRSTRGMPSANI